MKRLALAMLVALSSPAHADQTFAATAYEQAEGLRKQGKWVEACPLYEASYQADPHLGVLLHLAECHTKIGRIASAWVEYNDAIELAHQEQDAKREAFARDHADALAPQVPKLHLAPPKVLIPALVVHRDGTDITLLVGTDMPTDPGDHEIVASAAGYVDWKKTVTVGGGTVSVELPALDKVPPHVAVPAAPVVHEGTLHVATQPGATIMIDSKPVATGTYDATVKSGGHTMRVLAEGMRPYQSEVVVGDGETRSIDVVLEKEPAVILVASPSVDRDTGPSFETGVSVASGVKLHADKPAVIAYRAEAAFRIGRRVNFGAFVEYANIATGGSCGTDIPGPTPATPLDFGPRDRFTSCSYVLPGLQLYVHVLPARRFDPYVGIAPGFRFGFADWTPYVGGVPGASQSELFPGIVVGTRAGIDYHPTPDFRAWQIGAFFEAEIMAFGQERSSNDSSNGGGATYVSLFGGLRSTVAF